MKKINYIKFSLDAVMALLFVLFFNTRVLGGQPFHEIAGLFFAVMYLTHILLNWKWVVNVTRKMFDRKLPWNTRGSYALNLLLLISMTFVIVSGVLISKVVFPNIHVAANQIWFRTTHIAFSYLVLLLVGVHLGLHWQWVINIWRKIWHFQSKNLPVRYTARILTVFVLLFGVYEINHTGFINQLSGVTSVFGVNTQNMQGHGGGPGFYGPRDGIEPGNGQINADNTAQSFPQNNGNSTAQSFAQNGPANSIGFQDFRNGMNRQHDGGSVNFLQVIATYTGMMAVFAILTFYFKKITGRKKKNSEKLWA